jgi:hypothetical protein
VPTGTTIQIYHKLDDGAELLMTTLTPANMQDKRAKVYATQFPAGADLKWNYMQYKVVLNGNGTVTPKLYEMNTFYSVIEE